MPPKAKEKKPDAAPRPKSGAAKRSDRKARELAIIREGAGELLALPAMPAAIKGDTWAVQHFSTRGPILAERLVKEAERNESFRRVAVKALQAGGYTVLAAELFMYAAPALVHYGLVPNAEDAGKAMGVPVLKRGKAKAGKRGGPVPGESPPMQQPRREPQPQGQPETPPPPPPAEPEPPVAAFNGDVDGDELAAELGGMPPPPVESV
jgi:hypothetical protein